MFEKVPLTITYYIHDKIQYIIFTPYRITSATACQTHINQDYLHLQSFL